MADIKAGDIGSTAIGHYGAEPAQLVLAERTIAFAWNIQGDATRSPFEEAVQRLFHVALPPIPNTTTRSAALTVLWLGPESWLLVAGAHSPATPAVADFTALRDAMNTQGGALFDVSASRVAWAVSGPRAAAVLAASCPLDFHARAFPAGHCAQSLFGHVNAIFYRQRETPAFTVMVARSFASDAWRALCLPAAQYGYEVGPSAPFGQQTGPP